MKAKPCRSREITRVILDMNTIDVGEPRRRILGARFSASATLPFAKNDLTSDLQGHLSGGSGFADSYYLPVILGWNWTRAAVRAMYGFLAPTGRFSAGANNNVGSGYWTHALSAGQTFYLTGDKRPFAVRIPDVRIPHRRRKARAFIRARRSTWTIRSWYSLARTRRFQLQAGLAGYEQRQTTAKTGPGISPAVSEERYAVNALGFAVLGVLPKRTSVGLQVLQGIRGPVDVSGVLASGRRVDQLLTKHS